MGLYLCVFDRSGTEIEGVEIGSYADFGAFRDCVTSLLESGETGSRFPILTLHADSDGEWTSEDAKQLKEELIRIAQELSSLSPMELDVQWKKDVAKMYGLKPSTLNESFFDIDGELLTERLSQLAASSIESGQPILFQ